MPDTEVDPDLAEEDEVVRRMGFNPSPGAAQVVRDHRAKRARERRSITVNEMLATLHVTPRRLKHCLGNGS